MAIFDSLHEQEIPAMCGGCGTSDLDTRGGRYIWRLTSSDSDLGPAIAQLAAAEGYEKIALLTQQTEGNLSLSEQVREAFIENGGEVCADVRFDGGKSSYSSDVRNAWSCDPDAVFVGAGVEAGIPILQEWDRRGYGGRLLLTTDLSAPDVAEMFPQLEDETGVVVIGSFDDTSPAYRSFDERYRAKTGRTPSESFVETNSYDEVILLALAAAAAGDSSGPRLAARVRDVANAPGRVVHSYAEGVRALRAGHDIDYEGASGSLQLNEHGNLESPLFRTLIAENGQWVPSELIELER
jgi:branched-chain amino acid transport system substrate-binding protein